MSYQEYNAKKMGLPANAPKPLRDNMRSEHAANRAMVRK